MNKLFYMALPAIMACAAGLRAQEILPADSALVYRLTLEECLDFAMGNSYERQSILLTVESRELEYLQSRRERLPSVSASLSENLSHTKGNEAVWAGSYGLSTSLTLFQGGTLNNTIEQNRLITEQSVYNTKRFDNELTIQILSSFLSILGSDELLKYQRAVLVASEEQRNQGQALFEAGSILESDYLLLESQYASDLTNIVETEISRATNLLALKSLLSLDPLAPLDVFFPDTAELVDVYIPDEGFVLSRAMETLPDLIISGYNVEIAKMDVKLAKANLSPTVSLGASMGTGHSDFSRYGSQLNHRLNEQVGLSVSIPIFNRGRTRTQVKQAQIYLRQTELDDKQNVLDIRQAVMSEYQTVLSAAARYESSDIKQNAYLRSFEAYRVQFNYGAITTVELLQQQNNYISAMNEYIQNKYSYIFRRKVLDVYMGYPVTM
ncbi:MAG: TolC family protein [Rikenellaceae bacterium]|nr:TolC family protein [Rikenellaceae bacterium]